MEHIQGTQLTHPSDRAVTGPIGVRYGKRQERQDCPRERISGKNKNSPYTYSIILWAVLMEDKKLKDILTSSCSI